MHCVREALISTSTFYTLTMRADPPVSTRGTKVRHIKLGVTFDIIWQSVATIAVAVVMTTQTVMVVVIIFSITSWQL